MIIPPELSKLPIIKTLPDINLKEDFILIGATGCGKTLCIPPIISLENKRICILREPTRKIAQMTYNTLQKFWGPQLGIGLITSELKEFDMRYLNSYNLIVVTDGVLSYLLKKLDLNRTSIIFDEIHWQLSETEIELSLCELYKGKNPLMQIVLLSATIDPYLFISYFEKSSSKPTPDNILRDISSKSFTQEVNKLFQPQKLKVYYSEGITFPMEKEIIYVADIESIDDKISEFCYRMKNQKTKGLLFLSTRSEIQEASSYYFHILPTFYCHADTPVEELITFLDSNPYCVVFATIALSTSVTLPFNETRIIDKTNDCEYIESIEQKISKYGVPCDFNEILQKAGRVSRLFPGKASLVTSRKITWSDIKPNNIIPPLKKELPLTAALTAASHGINITEINLLSNLSKSQIDNSISSLQNMKFIDKDNNITTLGKRALTLPLSPEDAKIMLSTPTSFIPATAAFLSTPSMFYLLNPGGKLSRSYNINSIPLTKILLMQDAIENKKNLKVFCKENNLNYKKISLSMYNLSQIGKKFGKDANIFEDELLSLNFYDSPSLINSYRTLIYFLMPKFKVLLNGKGFNAFNKDKRFFTFFSDLDYFIVDEPNVPIKVSGKFSLFSAKNNGNIFGRITDATIPTIPETGGV